MPAPGGLPGGRAPAGGGPPGATTGAKAATQSTGGPGGVSVGVDEIAIPGTLVSGKVTFSDGNTAAWHLDQTGRLGLAPKQPGYRPSAGLERFIRCRDLTCRFPNCDRPAEFCDVDHAVAYPLGATHPSNLRCLCRKHHLLKTFWAGATTGWHDEQLPDATIIWTSPSGHTYTTRPGSAARLIFRPHRAHILGQREQDQDIHFVPTASNKAPSPSS